MADTGKEIVRPEEPYLIRKDGIKLYRYASENGVFIIQHPTEYKYREAIDVEDALFTYTETDEPIEKEQENINPSDEIQQKAEAFDYLTEQKEYNE